MSQNNNYNETVIFRLYFKVIVRQNENPRYEAKQDTTIMKL